MGSSNGCITSNYFLSQAVSEFPNLDDPTISKDLQELLELKFHDAFGIRYTRHIPWAHFSKIGKPCIRSVICIVANWNKFTFTCFVVNGSFEAYYMWMYSLAHI